MEEEQCLGKASTLQRIEGSQQAHNSVCCPVYSRIGPVPGVTTTCSLGKVFGTGGNNSGKSIFAERCQKRQEPGGKRIQICKISFRERSKKPKLLARVLLL